MKARARSPRAGAWLAFVAVLLGSSFLPSSARAGDPYLRWWTIVTPHFRVHYHQGLERVAQRTATIAEQVHRLLVSEFGWTPTELTQLVITDDSDAANGIATTQPYNSVLLYVTAPDDMSGLNDYDDWQLDLVTHEYTHIVHVDQLSGIPAIVNALLGKVVVPNQRQPRWILEGLAVAMETEHTTAGRLRSTQFDMFLRADALEGKLAPLDEISHGRRRWPGGNLWYIYGAKFVSWINEIYGPQTFAAVAAHYGRSIIPFGINRAIRRATGRTYPELYAAWTAAVTEEYGKVAARVHARGLREGVPLTQHGGLAFTPRFVPAGCRSSAVPELVYYRDDLHERTGFYRIPVAPHGPAREASLVARANRHVASYAPDCSLIFDTLAPSRRRHTLADLFRLPPGLEDRSGLDRRRERLSVGARAREPDVSPDGSRICYVTNHAGTTTLRIAELGSDGLTNSRALVPSATYEQAYTPRFSPDGKHVAYSAWTRGGYRDIRIVDVATGHVRQVTFDRALDQQPSWSPDGKFLYFTSDRTGIANVYRYDLERETLLQVTNVLTGAYMPEPSPDGRGLVYVGYRSRGFDLFWIELREDRMVPALSAPDRAPHTASVAPEQWPVERYNPLPTLRPRSYQIDFGTATFGTSVELRVESSDAIGHHGVGGSLLFYRDGPSWVGTLGYVYRRLPFDFHASAFRGASPRDDYGIIEDRLGVTTGISLPLPSVFETQSLGLSYSLLEYTHRDPRRRRADPWDPVPTEAYSGLLATVHLGYSYSNAEWTTFGISAERGVSFSFGVDLADPALGSESTLSMFTANLTGYIRMPWRRHDVLALAISGGASSGTYPRRGLFATGGFADLPPFDVYTTGVQQSAFVLRGYEPAQFVGTEYTLMNAEYRFPIWYADRGVSTLPVFLQDVSGAVFVDYGGAYYDIDLDDPLRDMHGSVGAELWLKALLGYRVGGTLRLGAARGLDGTAKGLQTYFVAASSF